MAEIGDIHRFAKPDKLARFTGIAPIRSGTTRASGGTERFTTSSRILRLVGLP
ncbi:transposase [Paenibacillus oleatilyticus]|uniref:Transposase n=1 Tax=Paenibacillus oleatilyticus TaxID=2594886 RepID=A0ABV4VB67_9BACL